ncbi:hypothetical protein [Streptomyces sp. NBC_00212]|uniref:hypothetical protein n=1 Tax=Streptomyces sp. NBC_00212 TaxID=2975684 RepID=UPI00324343E4
MEIPAEQRGVITEIVEAVRAGQHWRVGVLMERFAAKADLPELLALRAALTEALFRQERPLSGHQSRLPDITGQYETQGDT